MIPQHYIPTANGSETDKKSPRRVISWQLISFNFPISFSWFFYIHQWNTQEEVGRKTIAFLFFYVSTYFFEDTNKTICYTFNRLTNAKWLLCSSMVLYYNVLLDTRVYNGTMKHTRVKSQSGQVGIESVKDVTISEWRVELVWLFHAVDFISSRNWKWKWLWVRELNRK